MKDKTKRNRVVGQNGNDALHYDKEITKEELKEIVNKNQTNIFNYKDYEKE